MREYQKVLLGLVVLLLTLLAAVLLIVPIVVVVLLWIPYLVLRTIGDDTETAIINWQYRKTCKRLKELERRLSGGE